MKVKVWDGIQSHFLQEKGSVSLERERLRIRREIRAGSITVCTAGPGDLRDRLRGRICGDRRKTRIIADRLYRIRRSLSERLKTIALPEDAGILSAVLFGEKEDLDSAVYELYRKNGISHLLAISGLHVSIVGLGIWKIFRKGGAGFWFAGVGAGGFLCVYGTMVGSGASVVRAVSMALLSFLAAAVGRTYDLPTAMCIPAVGLLLAHPFLLTQASFQLSFLAVTSLVYPGRLFSVRGEKIFCGGTVFCGGVRLFLQVFHSRW